MIIPKAEKQSMFQNNLHKLLFSIFFCSSLLVISQEQQKSSRKLKKVSFLFNSAKENNILFGDPDYDYKTNTFKAQLFYVLHKGEKWDINLVVQPQVHNAKHQLLNPFFITPDEPNFQENRDRLTQERTISLYAFELGFQFRRELFNQLFFEANFGLGAAYIDKETERLARGFTFIENISVGLAYQLKSSELYLGSNVGHVSNFNIQLPNSGYNLFGFEVGYRFLLQ